MSDRPTLPPKKINFKGVALSIVLGFGPHLIENLLSSLAPISLRISYNHLDQSQQHENCLSWLSASWALLAIAYINMTNLPTKMGGYPEQLTFYIKSSPWACLANVVNSVLVLAMFMSSHGIDKGLGQGMMELSIQKFGLTGSANVSRRPVRLVLFILGALPQTLKLFSCRGILFIQFIASCYLLDFMTDEIILWYTQSRYYEQQKNDDPASFVKRSKGLSNPDIPWDQELYVDCAIAFNLVPIVGIGAMRILSLPGWGLLHWGIPMLVISGIQYSCLLAEGRSRIQLSRRIKTELRLSLFPMAMIPYWATALQFWKRKDNSWLSWNEIFFSYRVVQLYGLKEAVGACIRMMAWSLEVYFHSYEDAFPALSHTLLFPVALGLYFNFYYEAATTYKPSWVDWLG